MPLDPTDQQRTLEHIDAIWRQLDAVHAIVQPALDQLNAINQAVDNSRGELIAIKRATGIE